MEITSGIVPKAQKVVLYGVEGIGKTTFASHFPKPVFIDTEDSSNYLDVNRYPKPTSWEMLMQEVEETIVNRPCQTLVLDTIDWAEDLCKKHLCSQNGWKMIDSTDYGKRYVALATEMGNLLNKLSEVIDCGINVVVTAHAWLRKKEEPDEMGAYDRYELKLEKKTAPMVKEWADMVLFANYKTIVVTDSKTNSKKAQGGQRVMYTTHRPTWDAKNRLGLADELDFDYNQIADAFNKVTPKLAPIEQSTMPEQPPLPPEPAMEQEAPQADPREEQTATETIPAVIPKAVADLMQLNHVSVDEMRQIIYVGGFMPVDTPLENVPTDLWQHLASKWDAAMGLLNTKVRK